MNKKTKKSFISIFDSFNYIFLFILLAICIYPFLYIFAYSISDSKMALKGLYILPKGLTISNYIHVLGLKGILPAAQMSIARTVIGTLLTIFCCSFLAFLTTKKEMFLRTTLYRVLIATMYLNAGLIPWYLVMKSYHLNNNFLLYVLPSAVSAYFVILVKTFIEQLPPALEESAKMDGAGYVTVFIKIIFPLSMPIIATIGVFAAVGQWNNFIDNYFLVTKDSLNCLQLILYKFLREAAQIATSATQHDLNSGLLAKTLTPSTVRMTITMVVTLPIIFVYPFLQKYFVKGLMMGAIKG
jgi:putative aldouronate transport system permease protein